MPQMSTDCLGLFSLRPAHEPHMTQTRPTADFIDFLSRQYAGRPINLLESQLVAETWAMAKATPKAKAPTIVEIATAHVKFGDPLLDRLYLVRGVIRDTLDKMSGEVPPALKWASNSYRTTRITGIFRPGGYAGSVTDITKEIKSGKAAVEPTDLVRVVSTTYSNSTVTADLPLVSLSSSPTIVAQSTRAACKEHAAKLEAESHSKAARERVDLVKQMRRLQIELDAIDEANAAYTAEKQEATDAGIAQAKLSGAALTAERAARRAAKLAATDAKEDVR